jgi:signal transduction histidine kinase
MSATTCLLAGALAENRPLHSFQSLFIGKLSIVDKQLIRLLGGSGMLCLPLVAQGESVGVLAVGIELADLKSFIANQKLLNLILHKGALALRLDMIRSRELSQIISQRVDAASDLAKRVVHEVNNPLGVIKNYLKVLNIKLEQHGINLQEIDIINKEISRAARLLGKLTALSDEKTKTLEQVDVNAMLEDILRLAVDALLKKQGIQLQTVFGRNLPTLSASPDELKQVFLNLIKNAAEAMRTGGHLSIRTIYIPEPLGGKPAQAADSAGGYIAIAIQDDGPGIAADLREKLFEPYTSTKKGDHAGLGLSVVYNIIKSHGGSIDYESAAGKGTTFVIELPIR